MLFLAFFSCSDKGLTAYNSIPEISIQSHSNGTELTSGTYNFRAQASDVNHDADELEVRWFLGGEEICSWTELDESGESVCSIALVAGSHRILAEVRDLDRAGAHAEIQIVVHPDEIVVETPNPPTISILAPEDGASYALGASVPFQAIVSYTGDMSEINTNWASTIDGFLPLTLDASGFLAGDVLLSEGEHVLTLIVSDQLGGLATDTRSISVAPINWAPEISLFSLSPQPLYTNDVVSASITVQDAEQEEITIEGIWKVDGVQVDAQQIIGESATFSLDGALHFSKHQNVSLEIHATDGQNTSVQSSQVLVSNSIPEAPSIGFVQQDGISIQEARGGIDDIQCLVDVPSSDADGDVVTYTMTWMENGLPWSSPTLTTIYPGDTIPAIDTIAGQVFTCTVVPNDGDADGLDIQQDISVIDVPFVATINTLNYNGMTYYPLNLDQCTPNSGMCCQPTTTQEQMDAFCQLAGYSTALSWVVQTIPSTNCYCWGGCTGFSWHSNCCAGQDNRNFVTSVDCQ